MLVADSEPLYRWFVGEMLAEAGYPVVLCGRASEVVTCMNRGEPVQLALIDAHLPDADGCELARWLTESVIGDVGPPATAILDDRDELDPAGEPSLRGVRIVEKPEDRESLLALVREMQGNQAA